MLTYTGDTLTLKRLSSHGAELGLQLGVPFSWAALPVVGGLPELQLWDHLPFPAWLTAQPGKQTPASLPRCPLGPQQARTTLGENGPSCPCPAGPIHPGEGQAGPLRARPRVAS